MLRGITSLPAVSPQRNKNSLKLLFPKSERWFCYIELSANLLDSHGLLVEVHMAVKFDRIDMIHVI